MELEKQPGNKQNQKASRRDKVTKVKAEIKTRKTIEKVNRTKSQFLETLAKLTNLKLD